MQKIYCIRGLNQKTTHKLRNYAKGHDLTISKTVELAVNSLEKQDKKKKLPLKTLFNLQFIGPKDLSKHVEEIAWQ